MLFRIGDIDITDPCKIKSNDNKIFQDSSSAGLCTSYIPFSYLPFSKIRNNTCPLLITMCLYEAYITNPVIPVLQGELSSVTLQWLFTSG